MLILMAGGKIPPLPSPLLSYNRRGKITLTVKTYKSKKGSLSPNRGTLGKKEKGASLTKIK